MTLPSTAEPPAGPPEKEHSSEAPSWFINVLAALLPAMKLHPFGAWLFRRTRRIALLVGFPLINIIWSFASSHFSFKAFNDAVAKALNLLFIITALFIVNKRIAKLKKADNDDVKRSMTLFEQYWRAIWVVWALAYICATFDASCRSIGTEWYTSNELLSNAVKYGFDFFANFVNFLFLALYFILLKKPDHTRYPVPFPLMIVALFIIEALAAVIDFHSFPGLRHNFYWHFLIGLSIGTLSFVMMVTLVGRLDSKFLQTPTVLMICFYAYAGLQLLDSAVEPVFDYHRSLVGDKGDIIVTKGTNTVPSAYSMAATNLSGLWQPAWNQRANIPVAVTLEASNELAQFSEDNPGALTQQTVRPEQITGFIGTPNEYREFKIWRSEYSTYKYIIVSIFISACFFKALLFVFVLWLLMDDHLKTYFEKSNELAPAES